MTGPIKKEPFAQYHQPVDFRDTWRIFKIMSEFVEGYHLLSGLKKEVTFFGSARAKPASIHYKEALKLAKILGKNKHTIITGGGPGIMEAANRGAFESGAESVGLNIQLPFEQVLNKYVKKSSGFYYFFTRKVMLTSPAQAFFFFPGGFGTLDEFFEVVDLIDINRMPKVPVVALFDDYWCELHRFLNEYALKKIHSISPEKLNIFQIVNKAEEAAEIIKDVKERPFFGELETEKSFQDSQRAFDWKIFRIMAELVEGFEFVTKLKNDITILGTSSIKPASPYYQQAEQLARELGKLKYTIVTGGGSGIHEAANKGASSVGAESVGINISFNSKVRANPYVKKSMSFFFPFTRKLIITAPSLAFVVFPGGYGTLHQTFELMVLMQTRKIGQMPLILFGKDYWQPVIEFLNHIVWKKYDAIEKQDLGLYQIVDSVEEALKIIKKVPRQK